MNTPLAHSSHGDGWRPALTSAERVAAALVMVPVSLVISAYALDSVGLPFRPWTLFVAGLAGGVGTLAAVRRGALRHAEALTAFGAIGGGAFAWLLWIARPTLLLLGTGPDLTHHLLLIRYIEQHWRLVHDRSVEAFLGEMVHYTPGSHILVAAAGAWSRTDGLRALHTVLSAGRSPLISMIHVAHNRGKGHAVRVGLQHSKGTITAIQDADLELEPAQLASLVEPILSGEADAVYGSRFLSGSSVAPLATRAGNAALTWLTNLLFGQSLTDMETCYKIIRGEVARGLTLTANRFDIEPEITVRLLRGGHRIVERPVTFSPRSRAAGKKIRWRDGLQAVWVLVKHRVSA